MGIHTEFILAWTSILFFFGSATTLRAEASPIHIGGDSAKSLFHQLDSRPDIIREADSTFFNFPVTRLILEKVLVCEKIDREILSRRGWTNYDCNLLRSRSADVHAVEFVTKRGRYFERVLLEVEPRFRPGLHFHDSFGSLEDLATLESKFTRLDPQSAARIQGPSARRLEKALRMLQGGGFPGLHCESKNLCTFEGVPLEDLELMSVGPVR